MRPPRCGGGGGTHEGNGTVNRVQRDNDAGDTGAVDDWEGRGTQSQTQV